MRAFLGKTMRMLDVLSISVFIFFAAFELGFIVREHFDYPLSKSIWIKSEVTSPVDKTACSDPFLGPPYNIPDIKR
jgi:hypothetical protein